MKTESIIKLCNAIPIAVCGENRNGSSIHKEAIEVCQKFKKLFSKFAICHNYIGKSGFLEVKDLACLGIPIWKLLILNCYITLFIIIVFIRIIK